MESPDIFPTLKVDLTIGAIQLDIDAEGLGRSIHWAINEQVDRAIRHQIMKIIEAWVTEEMAKRKAEVMAKLAPELDKHFRAVSLNFQRY